VKTMMKTTRFRPIAPRPQEGVGNNASSAKDKLTVGATMPPAVAPSGKSAGALVDGTKKSAASDKAGPNSLLKVKVEHGKAETAAAYAAGAQVDSEISLDPKNFCYAELKPLSDFETSSMSTGFYGSYGAGYYGGYNPCQQFQYAGAGAPQCSSGVACCSQGPQAMRHQWNASPSSMCYPNQAGAGAGGQQQSFGSAGTYALAQGYQQQPQPQKSQAAAAAAAAAAKETKDAANNGVKLDLDQDSVANAFGEKDASAGDGKQQQQQQHDKRKEANESDGSVDALPDSPTANNNATDSEAGAGGVLGKRHASSRIRSAAAAEVNESTKAAEGSDNDTVATHAEVAPGPPARMPTSGSIASLHRCISSQTTNPLFFIEKRLACSFISEYLQKEKEAAALIKGFELQPQAKKQRV